MVTLLGYSGKSPGDQVEAINTALTELQASIDGVTSGLNQAGDGTFTSTGAGANVGGNAPATGSIIGSGAGAFINADAQDASVATASGAGGFVVGALDESSIMTASGVGSGVSGYSGGSASGAASQLVASGIGAHVFGRALDWGRIIGSGFGAMAGGNAANNAGPGVENIKADGDGSIAWGRAEFSGTLLASGDPSFVLGMALTGRSVTASGLATMAVGWAQNANIDATAINAVQFGEGTNATTESVQIGTSFMFDWGTPKLALFGADGAGQAAKIDDPSGGATDDTEARTAINAIIDVLEGVGLSAAA